MESYSEKFFGEGAAIYLPPGMVFSYLFLSLVVAFFVIGFFQLIGQRTAFGGREHLTRRSSKFLVLVVFSLSFLGAAVGITGGWSRVGVVGNVVPAVLTLLGGYTVYLFGTKPSKSVIALVATLTFTFSFYGGYLVGAEYRNPIERFAGYRDFCYSALSDPKLLENDRAYCRFLSGIGDRCFQTVFADSAVYNLRGYDRKDIEEAAEIRLAMFNIGKRKVCDGFN